MNVDLIGGENRGRLSPCEPTTSVPQYFQTSLRVVGWTDGDWAQTRVSDGGRGMGSADGIPYVFVAVCAEPRVLGWRSLGCRRGRGLCRSRNV